MWLLNKGKPGDRFARELIQQNGPSSVRRNESLNRALRILVDYGWVQPLPPGTIVNGKVRKEAYRIHPKAGHPPQGRRR